MAKSLGNDGRDLVLQNRPQNHLRLDKFQS